VRRLAGILIASGLWLPAGAGAVPIDMGGATTAWTAITYPSVQPDWGNDQQTGIPEADIVGDPSHAAFYSAFDDAGTASLTDGVLAFRIRVGAEKNPPGFSQVAAVGIDGNLDGALDLFVLVDNGGSADRIALYNAGTGTNTSPSTTSISSTGVTYVETASNYNWSAVSAVTDPPATSFDVDGDGDTDRFVSFALPFQDLVNQFALLGISNVDQNTAFRYVIGTSTQPNSLNQDLGGPNGGTTSTSTWAALGAISMTFTVTGSPVPEPGTGLLLGLGLLGLGLLRRRR
jgi:hypothetical protein